jgi:hypothetical protein
VVAARTVHRAHAGSGPFWRALRPPRASRRGLRRLLAIDFIYWMSFAVFRPPSPVRRAALRVRRHSHRLICSGAFGAVGVVVQGGLVGPVVRLLGNQRTLMVA